VVDIDISYETETTGGCLFPVKDRVTGKKRPCGETTLFSESGDPYGFCSQHRNLIEEFTKHKMREANARKARGEKNRFPNSQHFIIGKVVDHFGKKARIL